MASNGYFRGADNATGPGNHSNLSLRLTTVEITFDEFVLARWTRLVRAAVFMGVDVHTAEDLAQTALTKCFRNWETVSQADDLDAYVHKILINSLRDAKRRSWWQRESSVDQTPEPASESPSTMESLEQRDALRRALSALSTGQREVLVLRFYVDLTEQQTATVLDIALGTVKSRTTRAIDILHEDPSLQELRSGGAHES